MRLTALRTASLSVLVVSVACGGDSISPTQPELDELATFTAAGHKPGHNPGGGGPGGDSYTFEFGGDITASGLIHADGNVTNFHGEPNASITIDVSFLAGPGMPAEFATCFADVSSVGPGAVLLNENGNSPGTALITFAGMNIDNDTVISYELTAEGVTSGTFLPDSADPAVLTLDQWWVTNRQRKQAKKNPCIGSGNFNFTITVRLVE